MKDTYEKSLKKKKNQKTNYGNSCQHCLELRPQINAFLLPYVVKILDHPKIALAHSARRVGRNDFRVVENIYYIREQKSIDFGPHFKTMLTELP